MVPYPPADCSCVKINYQKRVKLIFTFVAAADVKKVSFYKNDNMYAVMHFAYFKGKNRLYSLKKMYFYEVFWT